MGKSKKKGKKGNNFYKQQNKKPTTVKTEAVASNDEAFEREIETEKIKIVDCLLSRGIKHVPSN
ncbi:hypothetical protein MHBO_003374 [Bonamia ostreae]|uniref:Uncharacterized protein n=1 Tax=Bonamia ostreae TaxID=126728 RepID=A0ABV2AQ78_9EUKA